MAAMVRRKGISVSLEEIACVHFLAVIATLYSR